MAFFSVICSGCSGAAFVSCFIALYFSVWATLVTGRFYIVACVQQQQIQKAHADFQRQESVTAAGIDQRGWLTRGKALFTDKYSSERVNERRLSRAKEAVERANQVHCCTVCLLLTHQALPAALKCMITQTSAHVLLDLGFGSEQAEF